MSDHPAEPQGSQGYVPRADPPPHYDDPVLLEEDETIPPRPEEEIADRLRQDPQ